MIYLIIALSFAISSFFFLHKKGLKDANMLDYPIFYDIFYIIFSFIGFPLVFFVWITCGKEFSKIYGEELARLIREDD